MCGRDYSGTLFPESVEGAPRSPDGHEARARTLRARRPVLLFPGDQLLPPRMDLLEQRRGHQSGPSRLAHAPALDSCAARSAPPSFRLPFVIDHFWQTPAELADLRRHLGAADSAGEVRCFLLTLPLDETLMRIRRRQSARALDERELE